MRYFSQVSHDLTCHGVMGAYWGRFPLPSSGYWLGWGSVSLSHLLTRHPPTIRLLLMRRERCIFDSRGVILTLIIHWLRPPLFLPQRSEPTLAIWSERLAKSPYQENNRPAMRLEPVINKLLLPIDLSWPRTWVDRSLIQAMLIHAVMIRWWAVSNTSKTLSPCLDHYVSRDVRVTTEISLISECQTTQAPLSLLGENIECILIATDTLFCYWAFAS